ncbi:MAG: hypothetical protein FJ104_12925 [Deltaproteobacteria bacterium]|nr:hypothetical protein [Deltaproteobacteria bacterium]
MVKPSHILGGAIASALLTVSGVSLAGESMNPALGRLVLDHRCHATNVGDGSHAAFIRSASNVGRMVDDPAVRDTLVRATGRPECAPDNVAFKRLVSQLGFALAPTGMHAARTTGFGGFEFMLEGTFTNIDDGAEEWKLGTRGPRDPATSQASRVNSSPPSTLSVYSARVRKAFGFGLEVATQVGFVPDTTILSGGADTRLSLLEGFRTGFAGILPDVAAGAGVRTITGTPELQLTVVGLDAQISKPLTLASQSVLTPWFGFQYLWIFGDSGLIDTTPATDPVGYCQMTGTNVPGNADPTKTETGTGRPVFDGQPVCAGGSPLDFNNNVVFNNARLERQRLMFGLNYRYEMVSLGGEFIFDLVDPEDAQTGTDTMTFRQGGKVVTVSDKQALADTPRQWTLALQVGAMF